MLLRKANGWEYDRGVRYYTTELMPGRTIFKCLMCPHNVTTVDFNSVMGNRRTQAASAMNKHAFSSHPDKLRGPIIPNTLQRG